ncbi:MAG: mechanosensitive ion channel family protein [Xanthobacteraceae bacterium]
MTRITHFSMLSAVLLTLLVSAPAAFGQSAAPAATHNKTGATAPADDKAAAQPADSRINTTDVNKRVDAELGADLQATTADWQRQLDLLEKELNRPHLRYSELNEFRDQLQRVRSEAADLWNRLQPRLQADKAQMDLFGPAPATGQPAEPEQTALARAELNYHSRLLTGAQTAVNSTNLRIETLLNAIQDVRRKNFSSVLFQPIPRVYAYETWANLPDHVPAAARKIRDLIADWWQNNTDRREIGYAAIEALLLALLLGAACWRGIRRIRRAKESAESPPFWRRASAAATLVALRALPVVLPVVFLYGMIASTQNLPERIDWLFYLTAQSLVIVFTVWALAGAVFSPSTPHWRLVPTSDAAAARLRNLTTLLAVVYSLTTFLYVATRLVQAPFALTIAIALPSSLLMAGIVVALLRTPLGAANGAAPPRLFKLVRTAVWVIVAAIIVCAVAGYLPLARFLAQQLVVTGSILALIYLLLLWVDGFAQGLTDDGTMVAGWLKRGAALEQPRREQLALPISLLLKVAVLVLSVPLIMLQWGYTGPDIREWYWQLFFGLRIGNTDVTFGALLASILVFGVGYAAARLFQGWLDARVLQPAGISGGVRNSIRTGIGYAGIVVAALLAFSYAGFSLSNVAIIAGALSVGIGFGLQNLVNNFVSGLILLAERPIRVGDMVVVGGEEGYVRKISVRSTELETFDGAHVLVPNSYFVAEKVKNWTFRNNIRRIAIPIGVAYGSDAREVQAVLLKVAADNPDVLKTPAPAVTLDEFASGSVNFTLYAFIADITKTGSVRTELAMTILAAFAQTGIVIPFGQTDVSIRQMDWLRDVIAEYAAPALAPHAGNGRRAPSHVAAE